MEFCRLLKNSPDIGSLLFFCNGRLLKPFSMVETGHYPVFGIESG